MSNAPIKEPISGQLTAPWVSFFRRVSDLLKAWESGSIGGGGGTPATPIPAKQNGTTVVADVQSLNFGDGIVVADGGDGEVDITADGQAKLAFINDGTQLGSSGTVNALEITGIGYSMTRDGNKIVLDLSPGNLALITVTAGYAYEIYSMAPYSVQT